MYELPYQTEPTGSCWSKPRPALPNHHVDERKNRAWHGILSSNRECWNSFVSPLK